MQRDGAGQNPIVVIARHYQTTRACWTACPSPAASSCLVWSLFRLWPRSRWAWSRGETRYHCDYRLLQTSTANLHCTPPMMEDAESIGWAEAHGTTDCRPYLASQTTGSVTARHAIPTSSHRNRHTKPSRIISWAPRAHTAGFSYGKVDGGPGIMAPPSIGRFARHGLLRRFPIHAAELKPDRFFVREAAMSVDQRLGP